MSIPLRCITFICFFVAQCAFHPSSPCTSSLHSLQERVPLGPYLFRDESGFNANTANAEVILLSEDIVSFSGVMNKESTASARILRQHLSLKSRACTYRLFLLLLFLFIIAAHGVIHHLPDVLFRGVFPLPPESSMAETARQQGFALLCTLDRGQTAKQGPTPQNPHKTLPLVSSNG